MKLTGNWKSFKARGKLTAFREMLKNKRFLPIIKKYDSSFGKGFPKSTAFSIGASLLFRFPAAAWIPDDGIRFRRE
jgi:hypothetical protein